jgi:polyhydroxybutyrate depolymerase
MSPHASAGCADPDLAFAQVGDGGTFTSNGEERSFSLTSPSDPAPDEPVPLVVNMHGASAPLAAQQRSSGFGELGSEEDFIVLEPQAKAPGRIWDLTSPGPDVQFLEELIAEVEARLCVDTDRIHLAGFSQGGMLSMLLACRDPDRYASIGVVAGVIEIPQCGRAEPVPLVAFHGTSDPDVGFDGSFAPNVAFVVPYPAGAPRDAIVQEWALANGCAADPETEQIPPDVTHKSYSCPSDGAVEMYVIDDGNHSWPGSPPGYVQHPTGNVTQTIDATELIWTFFGEHARNS